MRLAHCWSQEYVAIKGAKLKLSLPQPASQPQPPLLPAPRRRFIVLNPRPAARFGLPSLPRHGLNLGVEARLDQRLVLIERQANVVDGFAIQLRPKKTAIPGQPLLLVPPDRQIERVLRQMRVGLTKRVVAVAGPTVVSGVIHHRGAHRIELDVALAAEQVGFGLDQRGLVTAFPQGAAATVGGVDVLHVAPAKGDDEPRDGFGALGRDKEMDVVCHQGVGMKRATLFLQGFAQPVEVGLVVLFSEEAGFAVMPALHDVQGYSVEMDAGASGHGQARARFNEV